jgi:hypothetical protein
MPAAMSQTPAPPAQDPAGAVPAQTGPAQTAPAQPAPAQTQQNPAPAQPDAAPPQQNPGQQQSSPPTPQRQPPPAAPEPQLPAIVPQNLKPALTAVISAEGCLVRNTGATIAATAAVRALAVSGLDVEPRNAGSTPIAISICVPHAPIIDWYARFLNGPDAKPLSPGQKLYLAAHNLLDPFNLLTIGGEAAIAVAADSHSAYGPGVPGWGRYVGVSFTEDMTGEFFGTFLIPSIVHQDPHYHREPHATVRHRILHAALQVLWTQSDTGKGMINYADLVGFAIDDEIGNLYVPGQATRGSATASRYAIGLATAPIDNYITEFLPDVARHVHVQVVVIQRIINQVARTDSGAP